MRHEGENRITYGFETTFRPGKTSHPIQRDISPTILPPIRLDQPSTQKSGIPQAAPLVATGLPIGVP